MQPGGNGCLGDESSYCKETTKKESKKKTGYHRNADNAESGEDTFKNCYRKIHE
jgi:hypothetical protein